MLEPPIANLGVKGIVTAAKKIARWPSNMEADQRREACANSFVMIDAAGGTGGGLFRYMYGRFLHEASEITGRTQLARFGPHFEQIGDRWQDVAHLFRTAAAASNPRDGLEQIVSILGDIADREDRAWTRRAELAARQRGSAADHHRTPPPRT